MKVEPKTYTTVHVEGVVITMTKHEAVELEKFFSKHGTGYGHAVLTLRDELIRLGNSGALR
jgi:hypothetical protein